MTVFLIDDLNPPSEGARLDGFAWDGTDFVIGEAGRAAHEAAGGSLPWSADGRHVLVRRTGARIEVGADFGGYRHLFYWSDGLAWAISDSFIDLVAHLRARGVTLTEDPAQTGAFLSRKQLFQQLTTDRTPVREIACLDVGARIVITDGRLEVVPPEALPTGTYAEALHAFLELWLGRIATLRQDPELTLFFHLSGGIDSRAVTAFHLWVERHMDLPGAASIRSLTDASHADDLKIAEKVAAATGVRLNALSGRPARVLDEAAALASWRVTSAGVYSPLRIPTRIMDPRDVHFSGHASNGYKVVYTPDAAARRLRDMERAYGYFGRGDRARWRDQMEAYLDRLTAPLVDLGRGWGRWQRVNRARFHGGQAASYKTQVAVFHSASAARAAALRPRDMADYAFYHDILAALAPELLAVPFDDRRKAPPADAPRTAVAPLNPRAGQIHGRFDPPEPGTDTAPATSRAVVTQILQEVEEGWPALPRGRVSLLFRWHLWRLARDTRRGRIRHAVRLRHLSTAWLLIRLARLGVTMADPVRGPRPQK
ncbi:hypothetical protein ROJ8625_03560 [Roseivivax jejudonensis]|uniref:Asparagine synthetase domain-containing protein n=1 Tax=Roseivivax jejudonensis TaxID=1529041 RepID=A0A1X7A2F5_9RHOB|nr:asparagine synthase-related protein [Roseivivax jejudonensis]SLN68570.1 hypothetical protein ROJ8625_03560 [Roseivivax jejudonensis]